MLLSWWLSAVQSLLSIPDIVPSSLQLEDQMEKRLRESSAEQTLLLLPATHSDRKSDQMHIRKKKKKDFSSHHWHCVYIGRHTRGALPHEFQPQIKISLPAIAFPTIVWSKLCVGCWNDTNLHLPIHYALQTSRSYWGRSLAVTTSPRVTHWCHSYIWSLEFDFPDCAATSAQGVKWFTAERQWRGQE